MADRPRVAIVVPTPDARREMTQRCLEAVRATTKHLDVVVEVVESSGPGFRFSRSVNRGLAAHPDADAFVLLNDDCAMEPGWLDAMLDAARAHPNVGLVGAVLRYPSGRIQHAGGFVAGPLRYAFRCAFSERAPLFLLRRLARTPRGGNPFTFHHRRLDADHRIDFVTGACVLITKECLAKVGPYDEDYEFSFEDLDHGLRALEAGFEVALATGAKGTHLERASGGGLKAAHLRSEATFNRKWDRKRIFAATRGGGRRGIHH
ncbi:MAG: glycosyltransferase family 2 protein [Thermoplasmatota archaeon]